jgi:SAM-dependent methyltransferase
MDKLETLDPKSFWEIRHTGLSRLIRDYYHRDRNRIRILEAGCGRQWVLDMTGIDYTLTGVDVSKEALEIRRDQENDLDDIIVGDIRTVELKPASYDVIFCSYVLEHIQGAEQVLDNFFRWLKPNGLLLLLIPDRHTVTGLLTRITPHWFHIAFHKYIKKTPNAGMPGFQPFPTFYDKIVSRIGINDYCWKHGYKTLYEYGHRPHLRELFGVLSPLISVFFTFISMASRNKLSCTHDDLLFVIENAASH